MKKLFANLGIIAMLLLSISSVASASSTGIITPDANCKGKKCQDIK
ncbi:hypothetical protein ACQKCU_24860 [Heyndrickxia sporothermodurans]